MDSFNDLRSIWHTAKTDSLPSSAQIVQLVKKFRNKIIYKKLFIIITACVLMVIMLAFMWFYNPHRFIAVLAQLLLIVPLGILAYTNIRSIKRFYKLDNCSNLEFLQFLEQTRLNQIYFYRKTQVVILGLTSAGLLLYAYQLTYLYQNLSVIFYAAVIAYLLIVWFVARPRAYKKATRQLNTTKQNMERILKQLEEE